MKTYYHVAGEKWNEGQPLKCWHTLANEGVVTAEDWHWSDAPVGYDGDVVCLYDTIDAAREHREEESGGRIVAIEIDDDEYRVEIVTNQEGFVAIRWEVPADLCRVIE